MANHYIQQALERRMILLGLTDEEIAVFINVAVDEKLNREKKTETVIGGSVFEFPV